MGAPKVEAPKMSKEEKALLSQQTLLLKQQGDIVSQQVAQQKMLLPFFAEQAGVKLQFDDKGNVIGAEKILDPLEQQNRELQGLFNERSMAALKGELPVDPALERSLQSQEQTLRQRLQQQFGAGYETSTPGMQAIEEFRRTAEGLRYGARTGQLTLAEQLGMARQEFGVAKQSNQIGQIRQSAIGDPMMFAGGYGANAAGYANPIGIYQNQRQMQLGASVHNAQAAASSMAGWGQLAGTLFGTIMAPGAGSMFGLSDRRLKSNIERIGTFAGKVGIYVYNIVGRAERVMGLMAQEVVEHWPHLVGERDGWMTINYKGLPNG